MNKCPTDPTQLGCWDRTVGQDRGLSAWAQNPCSVPLVDGPQTLASPSLSLGLSFFICEKTEMSWRVVPKALPPWFGFCISVREPGRWRASQETLAAQSKMKQVCCKLLSAWWIPIPTMVVLPLATVLPETPTFFSWRRSIYIKAGPFQGCLRCFYFSLSSFLSVRNMSPNSKMLPLD